VFNSKYLSGQQPVVRPVPTLLRPKPNINGLIVSILKVHAIEKDEGEDRRNIYNRELTKKADMRPKDFLESYSLNPRNPKPINE
jgi:hypothetical protein